MFNDRTTPLSLLLTRRSAKPRDLIAPGPSADELAQVLAVAARTPDHGKIAPWRFMIVPNERRDALAALLMEAYRAERPDAPAADLAGVEQFARQAPTLVVVLSAPNRDHKVPVWEQELSAGAAAMNLLHAAHATGYAGGWLTGWAASSTQVRDAFGGPDERIVGFMFIGTPGRSLDERPRPVPSAVVATWNG